MPTVEIDGIPTFYELAGEGPPLLLLHGGHGAALDLRAQRDELAARFQVHVPERPGHGSTPDRPGLLHYADGVAHTLAFLDALGIRSSHVVGFSDGAIIGLLLARDHPERVSTLTAISGNLDPSGFSGTAGEPDSTIDPATASLWDRVVHLWRTEPQIDPATLASITAPTLIMSGDRDTIRPDHTLSIAAAIPGAQLCLVPGADHNLLTDRARLVNSVLSDFLASSPGDDAVSTTGTGDRTVQGSGTVVA